MAAAVDSFTSSVSPASVLTLPVLTDSGIASGKVAVILMNNDSTGTLNMWDDSSAAGFTIEALNGNGNSDSHIGALVRAVDGTEGWTPGVSEVDVTAAQSRGTGAYFISISGADISDPVGAVNLSTPLASSAVAVAPSVTAGANGGLAFAVVVHDGSDGNKTVSEAGWSAIEQQGTAGTSSSGSMIGWVYKELAANEESGDVTFTNTITDGMCAFQFVINAAGGGGGFQVAWAKNSNVVIQ